MLPRDGCLKLLAWGVLAFLEDLDSHEPGLGEVSRPVHEGETALRDRELDQVALAERLANQSEGVGSRSGASDRIHDKRSVDMVFEKTLHSFEQLLVVSALPLQKAGTGLDAQLCRLEEEFLHSPTVRSHGKMLPKIALGGSVHRSMAERTDMTVLLNRASGGDREAQNELAPLVYEVLKAKAEAMMRSESRAVSVQATVLVNDAFMRLVGGAAVDWQSRAHFFATASRVMRRVLVDHARARSRLKRGGGAVTVQLDEALTVSISQDTDILRLDEALTRLAEVDPDQAEMVTMRFFGGMSMQGVADAMGRPKRSIEREWTMIKAWLRQELSS